MNLTKFDPDTPPEILADYIEENYQTDYGKKVAEQLRTHYKRHLFRDWLVSGKCWLTVCEICGYRSDEVFFWVRNTAYVDEEINYSFCCERCHEEDTRLMQEQWDEYYRGRI